jgi:hypothetical protein
MRPGDALEFLWSGQSGLFELARKNGARVQRHLYAKEEALLSLAGNNYFGPLARASYGSKKEDVAEVGNVLWADIDEPDGLEKRLARLPIRPSLLIFSGNRGFWAYWRLTQPISSDEIEVWNRGVADRLDADRGACDRTQLARLPGSYRVETGKFAEVVEFSGATYEPALLAFLGQRSFRHLLWAKARRSVSKRR